MGGELFYCGTLHAGDPALHMLHRRGPPPHPTPPHPTRALPQDFARACMTGHQAWPDSYSFEIAISSYQESELTDLSLQTLATLQGWAQLSGRPQPMS